MTSKQAFKNIYNLANNELAECSPFWAYYTEIMKNIVLKDLEILEIIKELLKYEEVKQDFNFALEWYLTEDKAKKLKEWLEK